MSAASSIETQSVQNRGSMRAHQIALDPTNVQATGLARAAGAARFAYNWALAEWERQYQGWKDAPEGAKPDKPNQFSLNRQLNATKREQFPWMLESTKCAPQEAILALGAAYRNAWAGRAQFPRFKKKNRAAVAFRVSVGNFKIDGRRVLVPRIGWVRMREPMRWPDAKLVAATFSERGGRWYVSLQCEVPASSLAKKPASAGAVVGVDIGVREYATSDGDLFEVPRAYRESERRLRRAQQSLSRKVGPDGRAGQKASANWQKQQRKVARIHKRTTDIRADWLHKLTNDLASTYAVVGVEDLNVSGMVKNKCLAKSVLDAGFAEFRRQLNYKTADHGGQVITANRWYPSSRTCSACGVVKTNRLPLSVRKWTCENCGTSHHRDINAAINLRNLAASSAVTACGEFSATDPPRVSVAGQAASAKQEPASKRTAHAVTTLA